MKVWKQLLKITTMCRKEQELEYLQDEIRDEYLDMNCSELRDQIAALQQDQEMDKYERKVRLSVLKELLQDARIDRDTFFENDWDFLKKKQKLSDRPVWELFYGCRISGQTGGTSAGIASFADWKGGAKRSTARPRPVKIYFRTDTAFFAGKRRK